MFMWGFAWIGLDGQFSFLFSTDANGLFHIRDEYFAIADFACFGGFDDDGDCVFRLRVGQYEFDFDFGKEVHRVLAAAVDFRVALLTAEAFDFTDRHAGDADFSKSVFEKSASPA